MSSRPTGHPLRCGRMVEDILDGLDAGRLDDHTLSCEHCTAVRRSVENLTLATHALIEDPAEPPAVLLDRVMQAARPELRRGEALPLPSDLGPADVSERAVAAVLRYAADTVSGVRARSCRVRASPGLAGSVRIRMSLSLRYRAGPAEQLHEAIHRRVAAALSGQVGLRAETIDLDVVDLWPEERA